MNNYFASISFDDWYIKKMFHFTKETTQMSDIFAKYLSFDVNIKLSQVEADYVLANINENNNILVNASLNYLLACSKYYNNSNLLCDLKKYIELFFENINELNKGLAFTNLFVILKWVQIKFPKNIYEIKNYMLEFLEKKYISSDKYLIFVNSFLKNEKLKKIFLFDDYEKIFNIIINFKLEDDIYLFLDFYQLYLNYLIDENKSVKQVKRIYCNFVLKNIENIGFQWKHRRLKLIREYMDDLKNYSDEDYCIIDSNLSLANQKIKRNLKEITVNLEENETKLINNNIKQVLIRYQSQSNKEKIIELISDLNVLNIEELKQKNNNEEDTLLSVISYDYLDKDCNCINYKKLSESELFSLKSKQTIEFIINYRYIIFINTFFKTFNLDYESIQFIKESFTNNLMVEFDKIEILCELYNEFFKHNFKNSIYDIIPEFEASIRYYLKNKKMNIYLKNGSNDVIGLSNIFNYNKNNSFRDCLFEIIDEDFYFTLTYFLTDKNGYWIRHNITHRIDSVDLYNQISCIFITILIFKFYLAFKN